MKNNQPVDLNLVLDQLILAMLPHVAFDGWSKKSLDIAAEELGFDPTLPERVFGAGGVDAVTHFVKMADRLMIEDAAKLDLSDLGDRARLHTVIKTRLDRWTDHREAVRRAVAVLALPSNLVTATTLTWGTADAIWTATGKRSHDYSWYTRRASLSMVFAATVMTWLDDQSEQCEQTYAFLERRMDEVTEVIKLRRRAWDWLIHRVPALSQPG